MKTLREKIEDKFETEYLNLEYSIKWLNIRRYVCGFALAFSLMAMYSGGGAGNGGAGVVLLIFFVLPLSIICLFQSSKLKKKQARLFEIEKLIISGKK